MDSVFFKLLNMSITAGLLVLVVVALRLLLKRAPKWISCLLWGMVGLRLIVPNFPKSGRSLVPTAEPVTDVLVGDAFIKPAPPTNIPIELYASLAPQVEDRMQSFMQWAEIIWLIGMVLMIIYMAISFLRIHLKVRESAPVGKNSFICDHIATPFILGVFRPKIYLPSGMSARDTEYVIAHERAHIKRCDHLIKPFGFLLLTVYWFNPLIWLAYVLLCRDIELACDEKVVKTLGEESKKFYSNALINCSIPRRTISACPLAFGEVGVKARVKSVLNYKKPAFWVIILSVLVCGATAVGFLTNPLKSVKLVTAESEGSSMVETVKADNAPENALKSVVLFDNKNVNVSMGETSYLWGVGYSSELLLSNKTDVSVAFVMSEMTSHTARTDAFSEKRSYDTLVHKVDAGETETVSVSWPNTGYEIESVDFCLIVNEGEEQLLVTDISANIAAEMAGIISDEQDAEFHGAAFQEIIDLPVTEKTVDDIAPRAAQKYCDIYYERYKHMSTGSRYRYSYAKCEVIETEAAGEGYDFEVKVTFVPENESALDAAQIYDPQPYTGDNPTVPDGAYEYYRTGSIIPEADGWHGSLA